MSGQVVSGGRVRGLRETMVELRQADPVLYKKARTGMRKAVAPIVDDARKRIPNVPTGTRSNGKAAWGAWSKAPWDQGAARKGVAAKISLKKENKKGQINLLVVVQKSAAGAVFDIAGKTSAHTKGARGAAFNRALSNRGGSASRSMWPAANSKMSEIDAAVKETIRLMEHDLNQALKRVY
jgi:hypothetical protein